MLKKSMKRILCLSMVISMLLSSTVFVNVYGDELRIKNEADKITVELRDFTDVAEYNDYLNAPLSKQWGGSMIGATDPSFNIQRRVLTFDEPPVIVDGRTYVPIRAVAESLGYNVSWDAKTQCVILSTEMNISDGSYKNIIQYKRLVDLFTDLESGSYHPEFSKLLNLKTYGNNVSYILKNYGHLKVEIKLYIGNNKANWSVTPASSRGNYRGTGISSIYTGDCSCFISEGRTLVPLRAVSDLLGMSIGWNGTTRTVTISGKVLKNAE